MGLIERVEQGMTTRDDAVIVRGLMVALARCLVLLSPELRSGDDFAFAMGALSATLEDRRD